MLHQAASRLLRKDMSTVLKKSIKELDAIDTDEFVASVEAQAADAERTFIKIFSSEDTDEFDSIRSRYLLGSTTPVPTFDFEL